MVEKVMTRADEVALDDDFEWVNAWAAGILPPEPQAAASPSQPEAHPVVAAVKESGPGEQVQVGELEPADPPVALPANHEAAFEAAATGDAAVSDRVQSTEEKIDPAVCDVLDAEPPPIAPLALDTAEEQAQEDAETANAVASDENVAVSALPDAIEPVLPTAPRFDASNWVARRRWKDIFRIVARNPDPPPTPTAGVVIGQEVAPERVDPEVPHQPIRAAGKSGSFGTRSRLFPINSSAISPRSRRCAIGCWPIMRLLSANRPAMQTGGSGPPTMFPSWSAPRSPSPCWWCSALRLLSSRCAETRRPVLGSSFVILSVMTFLRVVIPL
jgi:hypothetical protein